MREATMVEVERSSDADTELDLEQLHERWKSEDREYREASEEEEVVHRVALRVLYIRKQRGWTQQQLADRMDVTQAAVAHLEGGFENPSVRRLVRIARALEVDTEDLISEAAPDGLRARQLG